MLCRCLFHRSISKRTGILEERDFFNARKNEKCLFLQKFRKFVSGLLFLGALGAMGQVPALYADEEFFREAQELRENRIADLEARINQLTPTFYVAKNGNDQWSGTLADPNPEKTDGPFATLEKARDAVRLLRNNAKASDKSYTVVVREGVYELNSPVTLTREDSGTPDAPFIWTAAPGEDVLISAGKRLNGARKVTDEAVLNRLKPEVRDQVVVIDLKENGVTEYGSPDGNGAEIFWDRKSMSFSRYPNEGFINIVDLVREGTHEADIRGTKGIQEGIFYFDDDELLTWDQEKDIWVNGYWFWDWANQRQQVESIDKTAKILRLKPPYHHYGYRADMWFYVYNLLSEIDVPGEYYIDRESGLLYCYPLEKSTELIEITMLPSVFILKDVSNIVFHGFTLELSRGTLMKMDGGENNSVTGCTFRNAGGTALKGSGTNHLVFGCHIHDMGVGGVYLSGGDRETLKPGYHAIVNNTIHHYGRITRTYSQAVEISGVGNYVGNNKISDAPHMAISFSGNDELMEYNEIDNVCCDSNDAGAIYSGRNWTMRGNLLRYNYLHDISGFRGEGCVGMYLDDMFSSADMVGNLFVNVTRAMLIGGGRDNHVYNNVFIDCQPALHIDSRALDWCSDHADSWIQENEEKGTISGIKWNQPPYRDRYPELASIFDPGKTPKAPEGNVISRNVCYQTNGDYSNTHWIQKEARPYLRIEDNIIGEDPGFVDAEHGDYHFKPGSPALKAGIPSVPYEKAGTFPHPLSVK